jgi:DNA repair exonuclease SbcCD nuclease subunit
LSFRFVHTADLHLDSPLRSLALRDPQVAELIGNASRSVLRRIVDLCLDEQVDALLIAGDLYDGEQTSMKTALFLAGELARLDQAGIRTFVIRGNHDALSKITTELVLPQRVKVFGPKAEIVEIAGVRNVAIHGISFREPKAPESLLPRYRPPVEGAVNIGLMHTSLGGSPSHDVYAPCSLADLDGSGFRYWALGHIHRRSADVGRATVVMPGIPQGRDINEPGAGSVSLVTVQDDGQIAVEERIMAAARFDRLPVDLTGETDWSDAVGRIGRALEEIAADGDLHRVIRIGLTGTTPLAWRLRREIDLMETEARHLAERIGGISIEKMETRCAPIEIKSQAAGAVDELARLIEGDVLSSPAFSALALEAAEELAKSLPPELRGMLGTDETGFRESLQALARDGADLVLARLRDADPGAA